MCITFYVITDGISFDVIMPLQPSTTKSLNHTIDLDSNMVAYCCCLFLFATTIFQYCFWGFSIQSVYWLVWYEKIQNSSFWRDFCHKHKLENSHLRDGNQTFPISSISVSCIYLWFLFFFVSRFSFHSVDILCAHKYLFKLRFMPK